MPAAALRSLPAAAPAVESSIPALRVLPDPPKPAVGGRLNFGKLATAAAPKKGGKDYPVAVLDGNMNEAVSELLRQKAEYSGLEGSISALTRELRENVGHQYFQAVSGHGDALSSIIAPGLNGDQARVTFTSRYLQVTSDAGIVVAIGADRAAEFFTTGVSFKIDLAKVPEDKQQDLVNALLPVFEQFECASAVAVKEVIVPRPEFHALRHRRFTPEENLALDAAIPMVVSVAAKK